MSIESSKRTGELSYEITSGDFKINSDVTEALGGNNSAPSPHDYLEAALAGCTAITLQMYAKRKNIPLESTDVKIKIVEEGALNRIQRDVHLVGDLTEEQRKLLFSIAEKCPVHKFITRGAQIESKLV